jgi:hypothetical protein
MASQKLQQACCSASRDTKSHRQIRDVITAFCNSKKGANGTGRDGPAWHIKCR